MDKLKIKQTLTDIVDAAIMPVESQGEQQIRTATIILRFPQSMYTLRAYLDNSGKWMIGSE